jgi:DNA-directed RNA polymerase omega subunit
MNKNTVIDKCLEAIPYRFDLVILASQRAASFNLKQSSIMHQRASYFI